MLGMSSSVFIGSVSRYVCSQNIDTWIVYDVQSRLGKFLEKFARQNYGKASLLKCKPSEWLESAGGNRAGFDTARTEGVGFR